LDLSVIIPNWNGATVLVDCVGDVLADLEGSGLYLRLMQQAQRFVQLRS
jgi:hypothetical protein